MFVKGQSGNPKGRPKSSFAHAEELRNHICPRAAELIEELFKIALNQTGIVDSKTQLRAIEILLERGFGKAAQPKANGEPDGQAPAGLVIIVQNMAEAERLCASSDEQNVILPANGYEVVGPDEDNLPANGYEVVGPDEDNSDDDPSEPEEALAPPSAEAEPAPVKPRKPCANKNSASGKTCESGQVEDGPGQKAAQRPAYRDATINAPPIDSLECVIDGPGKVLWLPRKPPAAKK